MITKCNNFRYRNKRGDEKRICMYKIDTDLNNLHLSVINMSTDDDIVINFILNKEEVNELINMLTELNNHETIS